MSGLFAQFSFAGFGPDQLHGGGEQPTFEFIAGSKPAVLRKHLRQRCPRQAGVYGMLDRRGALVYVGKAKVLRNRLLSYFRSASRDDKAGRIIARTRAILWEPAPNEFAALIRELELIRRWRPRYNVIGIPGRERYIYLCVGRKPAPYAFATRDPNGKEIACYGPIRGASFTREAARRINDLFGLRDCAQHQPMHFAEQRDLFPILRTPGCIRADLGTCLGPCAGNTTRGTYSRHVRAARDFLDGTDLKPLEKLESDMAKAAEQCQFERAAAIRDRLLPLQWIRQRLDWLQNARQEHSFVYPIVDEDGTGYWYFIHRGRVCKAIPAPHDAASMRVATEAIELVFGSGKSAFEVVPIEQVDHVLLVAAWFRKRPSERERVMKPEQAAAETCGSPGNFGAPTMEATPVRRR